MSEDRDAARLVKEVDAYLADDGEVRIEAEQFAAELMRALVPPLRRLAGPDTPWRRGLIVDLLRQVADRLGEEA